jgi:hypothetical protein
VVFDKPDSLAEDGTGHAELLPKRRLRPQHLAHRPAPVDDLVLEGARDTRRQLAL